MPNLICLNNLKGVGSTCAQVTPLTGMLGFVLARPGFTFADAESFATQSNWSTGIGNKDLFPVQNVRSQENQKVEDNIEATSYGDKIFNWTGKKGLRLMLTLSKDQHEILKTYSDLKWTMFRLDRNNNIWGILNADGTIQGIELDYFHVFEQTEPTEGETVKTPVEFQEADPGEWDTKGCYVTPTFRVKNLAPITYVTITAGTVATNAFTATVAYVPAKRFNADGTAVSVALTGLADTNFEVIDQTGAVNVLASVVESTVTPGTYTITGATLTSGTVKVKPIAAALYESNTATLASA